MMNYECMYTGVKLNYKKLKQREKEMRRQAKALKKEARHKKKEERAREQKDEKRQSRARESTTCSSKSKDYVEPQSDSQSESSSSDVQEDEEWQQVVSKSSKKVYWYNARTGQTQWHAPASSPCASAPASSATRHADQTAPACRDLREKDEEGGGAKRPKLLHAPACQPHQDRGKDDGGKAEVFDGHSCTPPTSQHLQDKETKEAGDMWRRPAAQLLADDDEFQDYFQGMFP
mmetsp:Transcript_59825/g.96878  ORF Transcript_59825/g.96878 Transcript_59825/m.96878 type:complete len:232 (-) Transcript_59825:239-934(-)